MAEVAAASDLYATRSLRGRLLALAIGTGVGTALASGSSHCLVGCSVAPGFEFGDFELADNDELEERYPAARSAIRRIRQGTRASGEG